MYLRINYKIKDFYKIVNLHQIKSITAIPHNLTAITNSQQVALYSLRCDSSVFCYCRIVDRS